MCPAGAWTRTSKTCARNWGPPAAGSKPTPSSDTALPNQNAPAPAFMTNRRSTYFIFQALLTIVLLLFFLYRRELVMQWPVRLITLSVVMGALLIFLATAPQAWLQRPLVQGTWFLCDVLLSSITLYWAQQPGSDLYVTYFLVILGTALTENIVHSFLVALVATLLYGYSAASSAQGIPKDPEFWLRLPYLWIFASFTAMLTRDTREKRQAQEDRS